jgi:hypothetical protein
MKSKLAQSSKFLKQFRQSLLETGSTSVAVTVLIAPAVGLSTK